MNSGVTACICAVTLSTTTDTSEKIPNQIVGIDGGGGLGCYGPAVQSTRPGVSAVVGEIKLTTAVIAAIRPLGLGVVGKYCRGFCSGIAAVISIPRIQTIFHGSEIITEDARAAIVRHFGV